MSAVLLIIGVISIVAGLVAAASHFVDVGGVELSWALSYQAIVGGILLLAVDKILKHTGETAANTARMAANITGAPAVSAAAGSAAAADRATAAASSPAVAAAAPESGTKPEPEPEPAPEPAPAEETAAEETPAEPEASANEPAPAEPASGAAAAGDAASGAAASDTAAPEQFEVRGYMVDRFADGTVDVHTAEGAMRFESLEAFERELDRAAG